MSKRKGKEQFPKSKRALRKCVSNEMNETLQNLVSSEDEEYIELPLQKRSLCKESSKTNIVVVTNEAMNTVDWNESHETYYECEAYYDTDESKDWEWEMYDYEADEYVYTFDEIDDDDDDIEDKDEDEDENEKQEEEEELFYDCIEEKNCEPEKPWGIREKLRFWALNENLRARQIDTLLRVLADEIKELPSSSKTLLETPRKTPKKKLDNGYYTHFGLKRQILRLLEFEDRVLKEVCIDVNCDGLPLFKSSEVTVWPILVRSLNLKKYEPFAVGIFTGKGKPKPLIDYLQELIDEMDDLNINGIDYKGQKMELKIRMFICDAQARSYLKCCVSHRGTKGCERCQVEGEDYKRRMTFTNLNAPLRTKENFENQDDELHHKEKTPIIRLGIDCVRQFVLDPMHLLYLGIMRKLLKFWTMNGWPPCKLKASLIDNISQNLLNIRNCITKEFNRKTRSLNELARWKATEFRLFLLYVGPVVLRNVLPEAMYHNFLLLHVAITILNGKAHIAKHLDLSRLLLRNFVEHCKLLYGKAFIIYNVHSVIHLVDDVVRYGVLENFSSFPFENYLGKLKSLIRSYSFPHSQLCRRILELEWLKGKEKKQKLGEWKMHNKGPVPENFGYFVAQFQEFYLKNFSLSNKSPDNCVYAKNEFFLIKNFIKMENGQVKIIACQLKNTGDVYTYPCKSSMLGICTVVEDNEELKILDINDIQYKCMKISLLCEKNSKESAVFPLLHLL